MTGRRARIVRNSHGQCMYQVRDEAAERSGTGVESVNIVEKECFLDGRKLVAIISDAASTGRKGKGAKA